jgi:hypothetical protein
MLQAGGSTSTLILGWKFLGCLLCGATSETQACERYGFRKIEVAPVDGILLLPLTGRSIRVKLWLCNSCVAAIQKGSVSTLLGYLPAGIVEKDGAD